MEQNLSSEQVKERIAKLEEEVRRLQTELTALRQQQVVRVLHDSNKPLAVENKTVVRTTRGLTVKGTRLTLYSIMDEIKGNTPFKHIRDLYKLTDEEMLDILDYINSHRDEVEQEYQKVVYRAEEERKYWEERNRERFKEIARLPPPPGKEELVAKLRARKKTRVEAELKK